MHLIKLQPPCPSFLNYNEICEPRTLQEVAKIKSSFEYSLTYGTSSSNKYEGKFNISILNNYFILKIPCQKLGN